MENAGSPYGKYCVSENRLNYNLSEIEVTHLLDHFRHQAVDNYLALDL
jgi:hypothetical protein